MAGIRRARSRRGRPLVGALSAVLAAGFVATSLWRALRGDDLTTLANLVTIVGSLATALGAVLLRYRSPAVAVDALEAARSTLARTLLIEYRDERKLLLGRDFKAIDVGFAHRPEPGRNAAHAREGGSFTAVADYYRQLSPRRLVITGDPGSGKTLLALELATTLLQNPEDGDPVPFVVPAAEWDTGTPFTDWLAAELRRAAGISPRLAAELVRDHSVLPILDGLDEMVPEGGTRRRAVEALKALNEQQRGEWVVLTCRVTEYEDLRAVGSRLEDAARVNLSGISAAQARSYLESRARDPGMWHDVLDDIDRAPSGALAGTLTTPWLLTMVSTVAEAAGNTGFLHPFMGRPAEPAVVTELESELIARYVPAATALHPLPGGRHYRHQDVERWATRIARFLHETSGRALGGRLMSGREIVLHELWPLAGSRLPRAVTAGILALLWVPVFVTLGLCLQRRGHFPHPGVWILLLLALLPGLSVLMGLRPWPQPRRVVPRYLRTSRGATRVGWGAALGTVIGVNAELIFPTGFGLAYGVGFATVFGLGLAMSVRADIHLTSTLATGLGAGLAAAGVSGWALRNFGTFGGLVTGLAGGALALAAGVLVGIRLAGRHGGGDPDQEEPGQLTPDSPLRDDLAAGAVGGTVTGTVAFLVAWQAPWMAVPLPLAAAVGVSGFLAAGPGFASSVSARYLGLLLCSRGRLPWRLARFLRWGRTAGILRFTATAYQFRHDLLLRWLGGRGAGP